MSKIPKIIHYCWFGDNPKSELVQKCINSWKKYCPDYEIWEWGNNDLQNCNNAYVQRAYVHKKWAFITDYFRLYALYHHGGIYLDSDNEILKPLDDFLDLDFFSGYENWNGSVLPFTAVVGAKKHNKIIKDLLDEYNDLQFVNSNGELNLYTNTKRVTDYFKRKYNFVEPYDENETRVLEENCVIYPASTFCTYKEGVSYAIHHFSASWAEKVKKKYNLLKSIFSVYNSEGYKIVCILGLKFKIKKLDNGAKNLEQELIRTKRSLEYLKEHSDITKLKPATGMLRKRQLDLIDLSNEFFDIIKETNIKPFLIGGNLIGKVRHNGFIPWDDDIDFGLMREDYNTLIDFCKKHFDVEIYNGSIYEYNEKEFKKYLCLKYPNKFVLTIWHDQLQIFKGLDINNFSYIDFFPLDFYNENYLFKNHKKYLSYIKKQKEKIKNNNKILEFLANELSSNQNIARQSNFIYYGIDNMDSWYTFDLNDSFMTADVIFPLQETYFEGLKCYMPNQPEKFLNYRYESFMDYPEDLGIPKHDSYLRE